jgi:polyketide synthase PksL
MHNNIVSALQSNALKTPIQDALLFMEDGEKETARLSYRDLEKQARVIAAFLQAQNMAGNRLLLLFPTGVEFIVSLMGCWYAGAIAVPIHCPKLGEFEKHQALLNTIALDADIAAVLTLDAYRSTINNILEKKVKVIAFDKINKRIATKYLPITINEDTIAYLQYTSGSTSAPKAAVVTHGNLQHSLKETIKAWHYTKKSITLTWAPHTHVYGLVCGILVPLYHGSLAIIIPPAAFIDKPIIWLSAITKYRVTHSGCPNFGYDICVRDIKDAELAHLTLKHWKVAVNGGDIVQHQTLMSFVAKFKVCGFELKYFCSAYGMSELSGAIAVTPYGRSPECINPSQLNSFQRSLISSGKLLNGLHALVVDPKSGLSVTEGDIGEIWLSGKSVADGYWRRPKETKAVFHTSIVGSERSYFKTGDLGFISDNELYLTGRLKEVMLVYGKKYYPLDFELTVAGALSVFQINLPQVVFSTEIAGKEEIIVVQELSEEIPKSLLSEIIDATRFAITKQYSVNIHNIVFTPIGAIPKTGSGKLQRRKCQQLFIDKKLNLFTLDTPQNTLIIQGNKNGIKDKFISLLAGILKIDERQIDLHAPLSRYSFDSINIIQLTSLINETYQLDLSPAVLYEYANLAEFYTHLLEKKGVEQEGDKVRLVQDLSSDIAIIGMSGLFPEAPDIDTFWDNLVQGKDCITEVPKERWDWRNLTVRWGGFIDNVDQFDASFFNISPREAELIDPQQRLFLQTVWKTIEDAGYTPSTLSELKTGLFVGVFNHDYAELLQENEVMDAYLTTGTMHSMIANRISYLLNLRGPSEAIDTACSSSLVAIHQAVHSILQGDCTIAIAGGVNTLITPRSFISAQKAGMLSEDGRCKTFDKDANGYVRGEGVGAILLKKLSQALLDGDHIYGVIKGTAVNHGGHVNTLTAPNPNAQAEVIISACQRACVAIDTIQYIETHGTGTPLGDPIEINGLKKAFQQLAMEQKIGSLPKQYCGLGAVKTNIGHLESAAGIAGVIKILLAMHHEILPANLHLNELNPYIEIEESPFFIVDKLIKWARKPDGAPRRAGVSSFGFGGANAHVILEERPKPQALNLINKYSSYIIALSAMTQSALRQRLVDLRAWLDKQTISPSLAALSYTLNVGRKHFDKRLCLIVDSVSELQSQLNSILSVDALSNSVLTRQFFAQDTSEATLKLQKIQDSYLQGDLIDWTRVC